MPRLAAWGKPLLIGIAFAAVAMAWSLWGRLVVGIDSWIIPGDFWFGAHLADYVSAGALGYVYEADARYLSLPAWPIVLAPAAALVHHLDLLVYIPGLPIGRPSSWPIFGTYSNVITAATFVAYGCALRRPTAAQLVAIGLVSYVPLAAIAGHYEDAIALALVVVAVIARRRGADDRAALVLGLAISFKTSAALALGPHLARTARPVRAAVFVALAPIVFAGVPLLADWDNATRNLFSSGTDLRFGHVLPFLDAADGWIDAGTYRAVGLLVGLGAGWFACRRGGGDAVWLATAGAFLARALAEPTLHPYYLAPVATLVLLDHLEHRTPRQLTAIAIFLQAWAYVRWDSPGWWLVLWPAAIALVVLGWRCIAERGKLSGVQTVMMR